MKGQLSGDPQIRHVISDSPVRTWTVGDRPPPQAGVAPPSTAHEPPPNFAPSGPASRQASTSADYKCSCSEGLLNRLQLTFDSRSSRSIAYKSRRLQAPVSHQGRHPFLSPSFSASRHLGLKTPLKSAPAVVYPAQRSTSFI